jgi:hypothetical protein
MPQQQKRKTKEPDMPEKVDHHVIENDPMPAAEIIYHRATDNSGKDAYEIVWRDSPRDVDVQRLFVFKTGILPLLSIAYDEILRHPPKKTPNTENTRIHLSNAIQFLKLARQKDIDLWRKNNPEAEKKVDYTDSIVEEPEVPEGMKPIKEMTEKQLVKELADYGLTKIGNKKIDTSHWLKDQLQAMVMAQRELLYAMK